MRRGVYYGGAVPKNAGPPPKPPLFCQAPKPTEAKEWPEFRPPTREEAVQAVARSLAGQYAGPCRMVIAFMLAGHYINLIEREGTVFWREGDEQ